MSAETPNSSFKILEEEEYFDEEEIYVDDDIDYSDIPKTSYYIPKEIKKKLLKAREDVLKRDKDRVYLVDGRERTGKSTLAMQLACFLDDNFSLQDIVFSAEEFEERLMNKKQYGCIIFDEAFNGLSSAGALSKENKRLKGLLMEVGQRNLIIFVVMPTFFFLDKYISVLRSECLFHCAQSIKNNNRRLYKVYNYDPKRMLFFKGKDYLDYSRPQNYLTYEFFRALPSQIDDAAYRAKKLEAFRKKKTEDEQTVNRFKEQRDVLLYHLYKTNQYTQKEIGDLLDECDFGLSQNNISEIMTKFDKKLADVPKNIGYRKVYQ